ncbi:MAG: L,D-transpeptidase family protein [Proteobacteria bacterium]|nr:L,D-transpeptidase family protein [Pseudomonadota bacterium]
MNTHLFVPFRHGGILSLPLLFALLPGCALWNHDIVQEPLPPDAAVNVEAHSFHLDGQNSVIGRLASVPLQDGDTLLDLARHFGLGYQHITEANPNLDPWVPQQDARAILPLQFILPDAKRSGAVINLASMRLFYYPDGKQAMLSTWPIGIGKEGRSTPVGSMAIERKTEHPTWYVPDSIRRSHAQQGDPLPTVVPPGPDNPLGEYALYLNKPSYLIHGTNKPFSIGLRASNGCIRLYPEDIALAFREIPPRTSVRVVNQPYLLGWLDGQLYLEAHQPYEELDAKQEKRQLLAELQRIAKSQPHKLDWPKIEETIKQALGIPMPIFEQTESLGHRLAAALQLERPSQLVGQPNPSGQVADGWLLRTAETFDEYRARKLTAQLNHLGPRIPAVTVVGNQGYHVIAGPFIQERVARKAQSILNADFETKSELIKPTKG